MVKIGYNIQAKTARQQSIVEGIKKAAYYKDSFSHVVKGLKLKLADLHPNEDIYYNITCEDRIVGETVYTSAIYKFYKIGEEMGSFKKSEIKKFIYEAYDVVLSKHGFNDQ